MKKKRNRDGVNRLDAAYAIHKFVCIQTCEKSGKKLVCIFTIEPLSQLLADV